jgi:hypothetical protein
METRNGIVDDMDDEMELTEFYNGAGSQSVDCEASPPSLQVNSTQFSKIKYKKKKNSLTDDGLLLLLILIYF